MQEANKVQRLSTRVAGLKPSGIRRFFDIAATMKDVISLGIGEPDFTTPKPILDAGILSLQNGETHYTSNAGKTELREAIATHLQQLYYVKYDPATEIIATVGVSEALYLTFTAILEPGDEVIIPAPYWVSYADIIRLAEGVPVIVHTKPENNFQITPEQLENAITPRTKVFLINSPSNPTGAAYSKKDLSALSDIILKHQIMILTDDIYEKIIYDGFEFSNPAMFSNELKERTFVINGVSKAYSMTGWRIGYGAGHPDIIKNMDTIQGQSTSNATSIAQYAAEEALRGDQTCVSDMLKAFTDRRNKIVAALRAIPGIQCNMPQGAFYVFPYLDEVYSLPGFQKLIQGNESASKSKIFCDHLLEKYDVAAVPGIAFGDDHAIRLSYALSQETIDKGVQRISKMIQELK